MSEQCDLFMSREERLARRVADLEEERLRLLALAERLSGERDVRAERLQAELHHLRLEWSRLWDEAKDLRERLEAAYEALRGGHMLIVVTTARVPVSAATPRPPAPVERPLPVGVLPRVDLEDGADVAPTVPPLPMGLRGLMDE